VSRRTKAKKFTTIANFLRAVASRKMSAADAQAIIDDVEIGIGLEKRDREFAEKFEIAPAAYDQDPVYVDGFNMGVAAGYEAARTDMRNGLDILAAVEPVQAEARPGDA
jgi:hypothetical protein